MFKETLRGDQNDSTRVEDLELSFQTYKFLKKANILTLGELRKCPIYTLTEQVTIVNEVQTLLDASKR